METNTTTNTNTDTYKGMTIEEVQIPFPFDPPKTQFVVKELKTYYGRTWHGKGKDLAKRAITRALHGMLKDYNITYEGYTIFWDPVAQAYHIYSPKGTYYGQKKTFEAAKEAIDRQLKITSQENGNN